MKIAVVHSFYSAAQPSGENTVVEAQVEALRKSGHDVRLTALYTDRVAAAARGYGVRSALQVATGFGPNPSREWGGWVPDIVHVHNLFPNWGTRWMTAWRDRLVVTLHNYRTMCASATLLRDGETCTLCVTGSSVHAVHHACYRGSHVATIPVAIATSRAPSALERPAAVIALHPRAAELFVQAGAPRDRLHVIPNFAGTEILPQPLDQSAPWAFIGRLSREKGILELLELWPDDVPLAIYGDGPLRSSVVNATHGAITYRGPLDHIHVDSALAGSRGLVLPSRCLEGGIPLTYVEALAANRPVLAYSNNSAGFDVAAQQTGMTYDDAATLTTALQTDLSQFGDRPRQRYEEQFTTATWVDTVERLYASIIGGAQ